MGLYSMRGRDRSVILKVGEKKRTARQKKHMNGKEKSPVFGGVFSHVIAARAFKKKKSKSSFFLFFFLLFAVVMTNVEKRRQEETGVDKKRIRKKKKQNM